MANRILLLHQHFKFPFQNGSTRTYKFCNEWERNGLAITVITSINSKDIHNIEEQLQANFVKKNKFCFYFKKNDFVEYYFILNDYSQNLSFWNRIFNFFQFSKRTKTIGKLILKENLESYLYCYATSTPLTILIPALFFKSKFGLPFVFEVRDLWPEVPIGLKILKNPFLIYTAKKLAFKGYKESKEIVVASIDMKSIIIKDYSIDSSKISVVTNSSSDEFSGFPPPNFQQDTLNVVYFGSIGYANGLESYLELAKYVQENPHQTKKFNFTLIGSGSEVEKLKEYGVKLKLQNFNFIDAVSKMELPIILSKMHISYISFRNVEILESSSPNKFFDSIELGLFPIINFKGWIREQGLKKGVDWYVNPKNPEDFYHCIQQIDIFH